jgi:hypothetical protein
VAREKICWRILFWQHKTYCLKELCIQSIKQLNPLFKKIYKYTVENKLNVVMHIFVQFDHDKKSIFHFDKELLKLLTQNIQTNENLKYTILQSSNLVVINISYDFIIIYFTGEKK